MPDDLDRTYRERLAEARSRVHDRGIGADMLQALYDAYARMLVDLQQDADDEVITDDRARAVRQAIDQRLQELRDRFVVVLEEGRRQIIQTAVDGHIAATEATLSAADVAAAEAGIQVAESFATVPETVLEVMQRRRDLAGASTFQTLVNRRVQDAADEIDDAIESAVGRGVSWQRLTRELAGQLARGDSQLQETLRTLGRDGTRAADAADLDPDQLEALDTDQLDAVQRLEYDARRIAVTEGNNAFHETDVVANARSPVVDLARWQTSARHTPGKRYTPDVCTVFSTTDLQGFGRGLFHPAAVPSLPHPFCQCHTDAVTKDPEDFGSGPRDLPDRVEYDPQEIGDRMRELGGERTITDAYQQRQTQELNGALSAARDAADDLIQ